MNFPSATAHSVLKRLPHRSLIERDAGMIRPRRRPAPGEPHEVIWSEAAGRLIEVAASANARGPLPAPADRAPATALAARILVIDDDVDILRLLTELLCQTGYRVSSAADGEAGWNALCADGFDVVITDHAMPRLTGLDLLRRLRAGAHQVPVILISGVIPWEEADLARLLTPGTTLEKPFTMTDLLAKVRHFVDPIPDTEKWRANGRVLDHDRRPPPLVTRTSR